MALTSGTKLGPYEIQSPLGAGGMGEVYRARDTRLERTVAVKILPSHLSENPEAKQRFDREARTISSVNHPNICTLYDVGHQDGIDYLVMEYLEGETLADRLRKGPLPIEQVLRYGARHLRRAGEGASQRRGSSRSEARQHHADQGRRQADGLRAGQDRRLRVRLRLQPDVTTATPPGSHPLTAQGTVVGTFQYMSPEQVEGKDGRRALRHLRAGRGAVRDGDRQARFRGQDRGQRDGSGAGARAASDLFGAAHDAAGVRAAGEDLPGQGSRRALANRARRQTATEADRRGRIADHLVGGAAVPARKRTSKLRWIVAAVLAVVAAAALVLSVSGRAEATAGSAGRDQSARQNAVQPVRRSRRPGGDFARWPLHGLLGQRSRTAPNFICDRSIRLRRSRLPGTEGAMFPFWSPDSRSIAFFTDDKLKRIEVSGGTPVTICESTLGRGGSWNQDGTIVAALSYNTGISRVPASGGAPTPVTTVDGATTLRTAGPGSCLTASTSSTSPLSTMRRPARKPRCSWLRSTARRTAFCCTPCPMPSMLRDDLLYQRENSLVAQAFDPVQRKALRRSADPERKCSIRRRALADEPQRLHRRHDGVRLRHG